MKEVSYMKKTSRLVSLLLVLTMVLSLIPAALAEDAVTTVKVDLKSGSPFDGTGTISDPYEFYVGDSFRLDRQTWADKNHTRTAIYDERVTTTSENLKSSGSYLSYYSSSSYSSYSADTFYCNYATANNSNEMGVVGVYYGCSERTYNYTTQDYVKCADYVGIKTTGSSYSSYTYEKDFGTNIPNGVFVRVFSKASYVYVNGTSSTSTSVTLLKNGSDTVTASVYPASARQVLTFGHSDLVTPSYNSTTGKITLTSNGKIGEELLYVYADEGTSHEVYATIDVKVADSAVVTLKKGSTVVATSEEAGSASILVGDSYELTGSVATSSSGSTKLTWSSSTPSVVTGHIVNNDSSRYQISALKAGDATITATNTSNGTTVTATYKLHVTGVATSVTIKENDETTKGKDVEVSSIENIAYNTFPGNSTMKLLVDVLPTDVNKESAVWTVADCALLNICDVESGAPKVVSDKLVFKQTSGSHTFDGGTIFLKPGIGKTGSTTVSVSVGGKSKSITVTVVENTNIRDVVVIHPYSDYYARKSTSSDTILAQFNKAYPTVPCQVANETETIIGEYPIPVKWLYVENIDTTTNPNTATIVGYLANAEGNIKFTYDNAKQYPKTAAVDPLTKNIVTVKATLTDEAIVVSNKVTASTGTEVLLPGAQVKLTCAATSDPTSGVTLKYQWRKDGAAITGATSSTYTFTVPQNSVDAASSYKITCDVTATKGDKTSAALSSNVITLEVDREYAIDLSLDKSTAYVGATVTATGKVYKDGVLQTGSSFNWTLLDSSGATLNSNLATVSNSSGSVGSVLLRAVPSTSSQLITIRGTVRLNGKDYSAEKTVTAQPAICETIKTPAGTGATMNTTAISSAVKKALDNANLVPYYLKFTGTTGGTLYKNSTATSTLGDVACYLTPSSSSYQKLADVYFRPTSNVANRSANYTVYDANGNVLCSGAIVYDESAVAGIQVTANGASFVSCGASAELKEGYSNLSYVKFTLPANNEGRLYSSYTSIMKNTPASASDSFYVSGSSSLIDNVYFLPAADCPTTVKIKFAAYSGGGNNFENGELTFTVSKKISSATFTDVSSATGFSWAADSIDFMANAGFIKGTNATGTQFSPSGNLIRGDLVVMLYRMAGEPSVTGIKNPFNDVKATDYYYNAILWAYDKKVVSGATKNTFEPRSNVTREQIAAILWRYSDSPASTGSVSGYTDSGRISPYAVDAMKWAIGKGYITGNTATTLNPRGNATRAQVAVMLHRFLTK